jgi:hypothetical protein
MEGYCSTGQSPQRAVVPVEEEEKDYYKKCAFCWFLLHIKIQVISDINYLLT